MEFIIDLKFEDKNYNAIVHFVTTFIAKDNNEAKMFFDELVAGFLRKGVKLYPTSTYSRIDDSPESKKSSYEYYDFYLNNATASIPVEQFFLEDPDQNKSLIENLTSKVLTGQDSTAIIGQKYQIPVRVTDKETRNIIKGEFYYFYIEHLLPKE